jgi:hypothetical protein
MIEYAAAISRNMEIELGTQVCDDSLKLSCRNPFYDFIEAAIVGHFPGGRDEK